jgi:hypothetical protein
MIDISNEYFINHKNRKNSICFEPISEKQEESSNSSVKNSKLGKSKATKINNKSKLISTNDISIDGINTSFNNIQKKKRVTLKHIKKKSLQETNNENSFSLFKKRNTGNKSLNILNKRASFQNDNNSSLSFYNQIKNEEKRRSSKNILTAMHLLGRTSLREKKSLRLSNSKFGPISAIYRNKNLVEEKTYVKNKSVNLANSDSFLDMKYF